jgi:uncharacterized protein (TIGR02453 family)
MESIRLIDGLQANNKREWYQANKEQIEAALIEPAKELVLGVGRRLNAKVAGVVADPRIDRSIYRLHRDTRFSNDKRPYKDHLGLIWWQDYPEGKLESPCFYFHLTHTHWLWSVGCYRFSPPMLASFRQALLDEKKCNAFLKMTKKLSELGLVFNPPELKRTPLGFPDDHKAAEWFKYKGLYTWSEMLPITKKSELFTDKASDFLAARFLLALPLYRWLIDLHDQGHKPESAPKPKPIKRYYPEDF